MKRPLRCRLHLHRWRHVHVPIPARSMPEPTNPFELSRLVQKCSLCGAEKPPIV